MLPIVGALLSEGLNVLGNAVLAKGKEFVEEKTGIKLEQNMSEETVLKLKQYELENEVELQKLQLENNKLDLELYKVEAQDRDSARKRETDINNSQYATWLAKNASSLNGLAVMIAFFFFAFLSVFDFGIAVRETAFNTVFMAVYGMATLYGGYLWGASKAQKDISIGGAK